MFVVGLTFVVSLSWTVTLTGLEPSSAYVCVPVTWKAPPPSSTVVPLVVAPSPQSIDAV
jgi:hypothetical protein